MKELLIDIFKIIVCILLAGASSYFLGDAKNYILVGAIIYLAYSKADRV